MAEKDLEQKPEETELELSSYVPRPRAEDIVTNPDAISVERSRLDAIGSAFDLAKFDTLTEAVSRLHYYRLLQQNPMDEALTPEQIREEFPDLDGQFTKPMNRAVVEEIYRSQLERRELQRRISEGPSDILTGAGKFGASLFAHAVDPTELAAGLMIGGGLGIGANLAARAGVKALTRLGFGIANPTLGQTLVRNMIEAGAGNILAEPIIGAGAAADLQDYTIGDMMTSVIAGTVAGGLLGTGISRGSDILSAATGPGMRTWLLNNSVLSVASNKFPAIDAMRKTVVKTLAEVNPEGIKLRGLPEYERLNILSPEGRVAKNQRFYGAVKNMGDEDLVSGARHTIGDYFGNDVVTITDNPYLANNYAAQVFEQRQGAVVEVASIDDLRLVDLDAKFDPKSDLGKILKEYLDDFFGKANTKEMLEGAGSYRSVIDLLGTHADFSMDDVNLRMKDLEYDGYIHVNNRIAGEPTPESNVAVLFSPEKLHHIGKSAPDSSLVGRVSRQEAGEIHAEASKPDTLYNDSETLRELDEFSETARAPKAAPDQDAIIKSHDEDIEVGIRELEDLEKQGLLPPEAQAELKFIKDLERSEETVIQIHQQIEACENG